MKKLLLLLLFIPLFGISQESIQVVQLPMGNSQNEPAIWIDPLNVDHVVAGSNLNHLFISTNGGLDWTHDNLSSFTHGVWGDPCIITDDQGRFYYFHLSNPSDGSWIDRIVCQRMDDITTGEFNDGVGIGKNGTKAQDKEWAVFDYEKKIIYVTWTEFDKYGDPDESMKSRILFSKSTDYGDTFSEPVCISKYEGNCIDSDYTTEGAVPAVGPDGEVYVCWAFDDKIWFNYSLDQGETWLEEEMEVCDQVGGWDLSIPGINRCNGLPITVCDLSDGPNRGNIYVNYTDTKNGEDDVDVWLVKSEDKGQTWSEPIRVNQDPAGKHQFLTWMTIDQAQGDLYFVYYDRRDNEGNATNVMIAKSSDGGNTFVEMKVPNEAFTPSSSVFFGDYNNITAHDGEVRAIWTENNSSYSNVLYTAKLDKSVWLKEEPMTPEAGMSVYPNPIVESAYVKYKIRREEKVSIVLYNMQGQKVDVLMESATHIPGHYVEHINFAGRDLAPGAYYISVCQEGKNVSKRKVLYSR